MKKVPTLPEEGREFTANGNKYIIMDKISVGRWKEYEKLVPRLTFGIGFAEMFANLKKLYAALNKQQFADSSVICHNMMSAIKDVDNEKRVHPALMMAALFINREDENPAVYDEKIILEKIEDWTKEGLDISGFFMLSLNSMKGFGDAYREFIKEQRNLEKETE